MYGLKDYAYNGLLYLNNMMRPQHKRLNDEAIKGISMGKSFEMLRNTPEL
jgi:hypothetical protein